MNARENPGGHIRVHDVTLSVGQGTRRVEAVHNFRLTIEGGEFVCVLGPSGCGKSTLLSAIAGFLPPDRGRIFVDDQPADRPGPDRGVVFQQNSLFPWKSTLDNVAFGLKMKRVARKDRQKQAREFLALVGLSGFDRHYPGQLSGGMQQRAEIARVLINQPRVVLMDEPFSALDAQTRHTMQELLLQIWAKVRTTIVFVTHDVDEAIFLADRIVVMTERPGQLKAGLAVEFTRPRDPDIVTSPKFTDLKRRCLEMLRRPERQLDS